MRDPGLRQAKTRRLAFIPFLVILAAVGLGAALLYALRAPDSLSRVPSAALPPAAGSGTATAGRDEVLPAFALPTLRGGTFRSAELQGKAVIINFFASWCPSCWGEIPDFEAIHKEYGPRGLLVLGIGVLDDAETLGWMVQKLGITYPTVYDVKGEVVGGVLRLKAMPTTLFVDRNGVIRTRWQGRLDETILRRELRKIF